MKLHNSISMLLKRLTVFVLPTLLLFSVLGQAKAQQSQSLEYKIKAAFLYNFAKFVEWPIQKNEDISLPFVLCILGDDPFGAELDIIQKKNIKGRRIVIKRLSTLDDCESCHILFINLGEKDMLKETLLHIKNKSVLTVSDAKGFARAGGIIGFVKKENKIRFEINLSAVNKAGIQISSNLLKLATIVGTEKGNGVAQ